MIKVFKEELADECDYRREADCIRKFRKMASIKSDPRYRVPWVWKGSTAKVLVMERMKGVSVGSDIVKMLNQRDRDEVRTSYAIYPHFTVVDMSDPDRNSHH